MSNFKTNQFLPNYASALLCSVCLPTPKQPTPLCTCTSQNYQNVLHVYMVSVQQYYWSVQ